MMNMRMRTWYGTPRHSASAFNSLIVSSDNATLVGSFRCFLSRLAAARIFPYSNSETVPYALSDFT